VLGACWTRNFGNSFVVLIQFLAKILSRGKVFGRRRKSREHTTKACLGGQCVEGGKCAEARQHTYRRIKQTKE
jgi:hypothetical protein